MTRPESQERPLDDLVDEMLQRPLSRRTLLKRGRDLGLTVAASSFLTACGTGAAAKDLGGSSRGDGPPPKYLVMLIIDACRPDYLSGYGNLPNINSLRSSGTYYDRAWVGQLESVTPGCHATIGSGCFPSSNGGILGFWWEDPTTGSVFNSVPLDGSDPDSLSVIMADNGTPTMAEYLKRHDSRAKVYTASGEKFYAADAVGGSYADYKSYYHVDAHGQWAPTCIAGHELPAGLIDRPGLADKSWTETKLFEYLGHQDALVGELAVDVIKKELPRIVILNLPEMDYPVAHLDGGPLAPAAVTKVMEHADGVLGKLIAEYKAAGIYEQTVFMVLGDHGVTPLATELTVNSWGIRSVMDRNGGVAAFDSHTGCFGWLQNKAYAATAASQIEQSSAVGISSGVYYLSEKNGTRTYLPAPHTAEATNDTVGSAFRYLLQTMAGSNAPDIVVFFPEHTGTLGAGGPGVPWRGDHGGACWSSQAVPLLISGPGVKQNFVSHFPARLADLAPTAMRLLGVPYPQTDGVVLADAMTSPTKKAQNRQNAAATYLVPYAGALRRLSKRELARMPALVHVRPSNVPGSASSGAIY